MQSSPLHIGRLAAFVVVVTAIVAGLGIYPTWRWFGREGLVCLGAAAACVLASMAASAAVALTAARKRGALGAAQVFLGTGLLRLGLCVGLAVLAVKVLDLHALPILVWVGLLYLPALAAESWWLAAGLKKVEAPNEIHELEHEHTGRY